MITVFVARAISSNTETQDELWNSEIHLGDVNGFNPHQPQWDKINSLRAGLTHFSVHM